MAPSYRKNHLSPLSSSTSKLLGSSARRSLITIGTHSRLNLSDLLTSLKKDSKAESSGEHKETSGEQVDVSPKNTDTPTISIKMVSSNCKIFSFLPNTAAHLVSGTHDLLHITPTLISTLVAS